MKIYSITDPKDYSYARFSHVGTWTKGSLCPECHMPSSQLVPPLQIEWESGSDVIGNFSWCSYHCVVTEDVLNLLGKYTASCKFAEVIIKKPTTPKKGKATIPFPYEGPKLSWFYQVPSVTVDLESSGIELKQEFRG